MTMQDTIGPAQAAGDHQLLADRLAAAFASIWDVGLKERLVVLAESLAENAIPTV